MWEWGAEIFSQPLDSYDFIGSKLIGGLERIKGCSADLPERNIGLKYYVSSITDTSCKSIAILPSPSDKWFDIIENKKEGRGEGYAGSSNLSRECCWT